MAPFRRKDRPKEGYRIWPTLPKPWGRVGPWQTGLFQLRQAERVEAWVQEMALERPDVIDALVAGRVSLQEAWVAKLRGTLDDLLVGLDDPLLTEATAAHAKVTQDERARHGLDALPGLADAVEAERAEEAKRKPPRPGTLRISWLLEPRNVSELYALAVRRGLSAASVRRSIGRAVAELLATHYGTARRDAVMADVVRPKVDDVREVRVTAEELHRVLAECDPDFRDMAALAILRRRCAGYGLDERIFPWTEWQVRHRWESARDRAAGRPTRNARRGRRPPPDPEGERAEALLRAEGIVTLPVLRFKDLRHLLPTSWNALGLPPVDLDGIMGWAPGSNMRDRYTTARIQGDRENLDRVAAFLGLDRLHLQAAGA